MKCFCISKYRIKQKNWCLSTMSMEMEWYIIKIQYYIFTTKFVIEKRNMKFPDAPIFISLSASRLLSFSKFLPKICDTYTIPAF